MSTRAIAEVGEELGAETRLGGKVHAAVVEGGEIGDELFVAAGQCAPNKS